ncbi:MAG: (E)-4-hydroxy-3-methylbut-2-enyl-diphosphate synthase [Bacteroidales bacterium]|nr:(E)-4-hydroxy-3-methylbut-2-enyl-diphosphate synthase [Bacteroidales bacterium]
MKSHEILIRKPLGGVLPMGGGRKAVVQTMCNTHTADVDASVAQCLDLAAAGAELIRLTVPSRNDLQALSTIRRRLCEAGCNVPLVADVHFSSDIAIEAAKVVEKVRINPGNFHPDFDQARAQLATLIDVCREHGTVLRIGLNHGSLGKRITERYGNTPLGMKEAAMEWLRMCRELEFDNLAVSLKASNTRVMTDAYRLLVKAMDEEGMSYPIHLGVTEAGNGISGRIKSCVAISTLLSEGIGDTIRVSLTENPVAELSVARFLADRYAGEKPTASLAFGSYNEAEARFMMEAACTYGKALFDREIDTLELSRPGIPAALCRLVEDEIMQACRRRFYKPEYVACPGCGRTMYNLEATFNEVQKRTAHLKGMVIAVMGCIVNGPGEMADADWGYVGEGNGKVSIYKGKEALRRHVPEGEAIDLLLQLIEEDK